MLGLGWGEPLCRTSSSIRAWVFVDDVHVHGPLVSCTTGIPTTVIDAFSISGRHRLPRSRRVKAYPVSLCIVVVFGFSPRTFRLYSFVSLPSSECCE